MSEIESREAPILPDKKHAEEYMDFDSQITVEIDNSKPIIFQGPTTLNNNNKSILIEIISQSYEIVTNCSSSIYESVKNLSIKDKCNFISSRLMSCSYCLIVIIRIRLY